MVRRSQRRPRSGPPTATSTRSPVYAVTVAVAIENGSRGLLSVSWAREAQVFGQTHFAVLALSPAMRVPSISTVATDHVLED
jgi:hypothetical protein